MKRRVVYLGLVLALFMGTAANAILIDPYDNITAPDGYYGLFYQNYYTADKFTGPNGDKVLDIDLTANVSVLRPLYYFHLGSVPVALQVIVPFGEVKEEDVFDESSSGLGDIIFGPGIFFYANEDSGTSLSYWFYAFAPTGEWDKDQAINLGQDHWYFEHQIALNQLFGKFVYDMNLNLYHHTEDDDGLERPLRFELEASLAYQMTDKFLFGLHGGGYWDFDDTEQNNLEISDTKAQRVQLGPTLAYQLTERLGANLRWTHDIDTENDTEGDDIWFRLAYAF